MSKPEPHQFRRIDETMVQWANRLRVERGIARGLEWYEAPGGEPRLRSVRTFQPAMDFTKPQGSQSDE